MQQKYYSYNPFISESTLNLKEMISTFCTANKLLNLQYCTVYLTYNLNEYWNYKGFIIL